MAGTAASTVLVFGDQSVATAPFFKQLSTRSRGDKYAKSFLEDAHSVLRHEIAELPAAHRKIIPAFSSIQELSSRSHGSKTSHAGITGALLVISQLAHYISASEQMSWSGDEPVVLSGMCTGGLAAAAVASRPAPGEILPLALEAVRVAFRAGVQVQEASSILEGNGDAGESWAYLVPAVTQEESQSLLDDYFSRFAVPAAKVAYISAVGDSAVTISGPPSILKGLFSDSTTFASKKKIALPIHAPYHAPHIYHTVSALLPTESSVLDLTRPKSVLISAKCGKPLSASTSRELFSKVAEEMLREPLNLDKVTTGLADIPDLAEASKITVSGVGPINIVSGLMTAIRQKTAKEVVVGRHAEWISGAEVPRSPSMKNGSGTKLAIVGMAGRFPSSGDHNKFWELLMNGVDAHRPIPPDRFDANLYYDAAGKIRNTSHTPYGNFINDPGMFDPRFFNLSPREAAQTDPMQRLALVTAYEALEMAGYVPNRTSATQLDRIGTYYGQTSDDWREINAAQDVDTYFITGGVRAFGPGRINYTFKFSGPSFNVDTACSSSMAAIQIACTALRAGECDTAVAGGMSILTNPDIFSGLSRGQFLSKTGNCQTFDNDADGYCRADGIGTVIIKRLEDAIADNDDILSVILNSATNHSAEAVSITHPHAGTQEILYRKILDEAGVDPLDVDYVEMHGTGTQAGDDTEMRSVTNVFAPADRKRRADQPLWLGSVKANVGHGEAASGITALIKCLMMLERNKIPPHVGIKKTMNVNFPKDMKERGINIALGGSRDFLPRPDRKRLVYVNNFSAAGGNTGLLMEEAPEPRALDADPRSTQVISITAKAKPSLKNTIERYLKYLDEHPETRLEDLAYTLSARRIQHNYRVVFPANSIEQARKEMTAAIDRQVPLLPNGKPKTGFLFTGQGSVYASLGKDIYDHEPRFRANIQTFDSMATQLGLPSFLSIIDGSLTDIAAGSATEVQMAITAVQMALVQLWKSWGVEPDFVTGHSLGEYAALYAAGVLSAIDTIYLVGTRAQLLEKHCKVGSHAMLSVKAEKNIVETLPKDISDKLEISCLNGPQDTVLGGSIKDVTSASEHLTASGIKNFKLELPFAFHTQQIDAIVEPYLEAAKCVNFSKPKVDFLSTLTGQKYEGEINPQYLARHARESVKFVDVLNSSRAAGIIDDSTVFLEIGPHPVCISMVKSTLGSSYPTGSSLRKGEDFYKSAAATTSMLHSKGVSIAWNEYHHSFKKNLRLLRLPAYAFDEKNYWIQYTNDWCLNKNAPHPLFDGSEKTKAEEKKSPIDTTTVHKILEESNKNGKVSITTETDISREDTLRLASGHQVNGIVLLSSTVYADMATTICQYIEKKYRKSATEIRYNIGKMTVHKPFIADPKPTGPQLVHIEATTDLSTNTAELKIRSVQNGKKVDHGFCIVEFCDPAVWRAEWSRVAYLIEGRIKALQDGIANGASQKLSQRMAYKLFSALVDYADMYCGMREVTLNSEDFEATAKVILPPNPEGMKFVCSPCYVDSWAHITGFTVNASDATDSNSHVYISHGWDSLKFAEDFDQSKEYRSYVRMMPTGEGNMRAGDVYIFDTTTNQVVGFAGGVRFQQIPRQLLNVMLPPAGSKKAAAAAAATTSAAPAAKAPAKATVKVEKTEVSITKPVADIVAAVVTGSVIVTTMQIIAEEMGVGVDELDDPINFADMGCDSLMSLSISGRMREEMDLDVESAIFVDHPTVGQLKSYLKQFESSTEPETPPQEISATESSDGDSDTLGSGSASPSTPASTHESTQKITRLDLDELNKSLKPKHAAISTTEILPTPIIEKQASVVDRPHRVATSVLLQGSPRRATKTMWVMPDGGGSATSYMGIPKLSDDIAVYGLNSPYMKTPEEYNLGLEEVSTKFVAEIMRKQPQGPYTLAGWSAGGVVAYEACQQLIAKGQRVEKLLLIDSPCPTTISALPPHLHPFFNEIGLLGDGLRESTKIPTWLLPHFSASVAALSQYHDDVKPLPKGLGPKTLAIWCTDGVCKYPTDPRPNPYPSGHALFLLENKTDFGPNEWDNLLGGENMSYATVPGNHFTMMRNPNVDLLGDAMRKFMIS